MSAPITWEFVLRTFKRLDMIARFISAEALAKELLAHHPKADAPYDYLSHVWEYMEKHAKAASVDLHAHPNGNCRECGEPIMLDHNGARYCSTACRQRAYRLRKAVAKGRNSPIPKRRRTKPTLKEIRIKEVMDDPEVKEVMDDLAAKKAALDAANQEYALHLALHRDGKKRSAEPQSDASPRAESATNVTDAEEA